MGIKPMTFLFSRHVFYRCAITTAQYYYFGQLHRGHAGDIAVLSTNPFRLNVGVLLNRMADVGPLCSQFNPIGRKNANSKGNWRRQPRIGSYIFAAQMTTTNKATISPSTSAFSKCCCKFSF